MVADQILRLRAAPPAVPAGLVVRRHLANQIDPGSTPPVTLVSAGPGFGKTLTVASWFASFPGRAAWLTVDASDNDLRTFWSDVLGALTLGGVLPEDSDLRDLIPAGSFGAREALRARLGLAELPNPAMLVLDDLDQLTDPSVLESVSSLVEQHSPGLWLVLVSRSDPAVRLHRLRVRGGLREVRSQDLAFSEDEIAELFRLNDIALSEVQLRTLLDRTQGWPAGLRLAVLSVQSSDLENGIENFSGHDRWVAEYLLEEVLDRQSSAFRDFLLRTSIVERINTPLATALTGRRDSGAILENLLGANAFIVQLGGGGEWYRYHPLLRDLLQHRLATEQPGTAEELHRTAAQWFADHGEPIQAIRQATAAGDWDDVARLLTGSALPLILTPAGPALATALQPAAQRAGLHPGLSTSLASAICHYHGHDYAAMRRDASDAVQFLAGTPDDIRVPAEVLIATILVVYHRVGGSAALAGSSDELLDLLDRAPRRLIPAAPQYRAIGLNNRGIAHLWAGRLTEAKTDLTAAESLSAEFEVNLAHLASVTHLCLLDVIHGRLNEGYRRVPPARDVVDRRGWGSEPQVLGLYVAAALTAFARNRLDESADIIAAGLAAGTRSASDTSCRLVLGIGAVSAAVARGEVESAMSAADRLALELDEIADPPDMLARWCRVAVAQAWLAAGDAEKVAMVIDVPVGAGSFAGALERVVLAKAALASGRLRQIAELLQPLAGPGVPFLGPAVEARLLLAMAAEQQHRDTAALALLTEAVDLAEPQMLLRPFLDAGPALAVLVGRHRHVVARHLEFTQHFIAAGSPSESGASTPSPALVGEHLTERELIVLRYLPTMLKAGEIANDLYVSVNTVKSHLRSLYRKFDVTTRRAAVERARELNLL